MFSIKQPMIKFIPVVVNVASGILKVNSTFDVIKNEFPFFFQVTVMNVDHSLNISDEAMAFITPPTNIDVKVYRPYLTDNPNYCLYDEWFIDMVMILPSGNHNLLINLFGPSFNKLYYGYIEYLFAYYNGTNIVNNYSIQFSNFIYLGNHSMILVQSKSNNVAMQPGERRIMSIDYIFPLNSNYSNSSIKIIGTDVNSSNESIISIINFNIGFGSNLASINNDYSFNYSSIYQTNRMDQLIIYFKNIRSIDPCNLPQYAAMKHSAVQLPNRQTNTFLNVGDYLFYCGQAFNIRGSWVLKRRCFMINKLPNRTWFGASDIFYSLSKVIFTKIAKNLFRLMFGQFADMGPLVEQLIAYTNPSDLLFDMGTDAGGLVMSENFGKTWLTVIPYVCQISSNTSTEIITANIVPWISWTRPIDSTVMASFCKLRVAGQWNGK
ncbi:unnamed protein product [Schistosoma turkestanicum]|nr:unnamed protein product [Schistosoma turkestanicum]